MLGQEVQQGLQLVEVILEGFSCGGQKVLHQGAEHDGVVFEQMGFVDHHVLLPGKLAEGLEPYQEDQEDNCWPSLAVHKNVSNLLLPSIIASILKVSMVWITCTEKYRVLYVVMEQADLDHFKK